jgi:hypothetical protein
VAELAASDFERCRTEGAGVECADCPARARDAGEDRSSLANQACENATWDAGPDASEVRENCQRCGAQRCCESRARCKADSTCQTLGDCEAACTTQACLDDCYATFDTSVSTWSEFLQCNLLLCGVECGASPGPCLQCVGDNCAREFLECAANHDCWLLYLCIGQCTAAGDCIDACVAKYPSGHGLFSASQVCNQAKCPQCL